MRCSVVLLFFFVVDFAAAAARATWGDDLRYDLRYFEDEVVPRWVSRFAVDEGKGLYSYLPRSGTASLYGSSDAVHLLMAVGIPVNATEAIRAYQRRDGWYAVTKDESECGKQPYHAAASATAALRLMGATPKYATLEKFRTGGDWQATLDGLYDGCETKKLSANIHQCGQIIGSYPVLIDDEAFRSWWVDWIRNHTDPTIGLVCPPVKDSTYARVQCIGGGMPTHGPALGLGLLESLPYAENLFRFALDVQLETGGVWSDKERTDVGSLTLDGIFQVTRAYLSLTSTNVKKKEGEDSSFSSALRAMAEASCRTVLRITVHQLNENALSLYSNTSHELPNIVAAVAECAQTFPSLVRTRRPWSCCAVYV